MALAAGTRLGPYEILSPLGAGGMGEVWRARDSRLGRDVAVKVLPDSVSADPKALARFESEARTVAALSHPNILALHDVGEADGVRYAVTELLEGETLRTLLDRGPVPLRRALEISRQVAEALASAHSKGIVHRDVKPENVFVTKDGHVKLLDFGLALPGALPSGPDETQSPTVARLTGEGAVVGTVAYMSPEQASGGVPAIRSDQFALGIVLYEMLAGSKPFHGASVAETLTAIIREEPEPLARIAPSVPAPICWIVERLLAKEPGGRYDATADLARDLRMWSLNLSESATASGAGWRSGRGQGPSRGSGRSASVLLVAGGVLAGAILTGALLRGKSRTPLPVQRFEVRLPEGHYFSQWRRPFALSPDGRSLVFSAFSWKKPFEERNEPRLFLRPFDSFEARPIPGTEGGVQPFFSPDGRNVAFTVRSEGKVFLRRVSVAGGPATTICPCEATFGASWSPDGSIVFASEAGPLQRVPDSGGTPEPATALDAGESEVSHRLPHVLPDGSAVVYTALRWQSAGMSWTKARIYGQRLGEKRRSLVAEGGSDGRWAPPGNLLFAREGRLFAARFDAKALRLDGKPVPVVEGVSHSVWTGDTFMETGAAMLDVSRTGAFAWLSGSVSPESELSLVLVETSGRETPIDLPKGPFLTGKFSPDGERILVSYNYPGRQVEVVDLARGSRRNVTFDVNPLWVIWGPGPDRVTFTSDHEGPGSIYTRKIDAGPEEIETLWKGAGRGDLGLGSWSRDGKTLAFTVNDVKSGEDIWLLDAGKAPRPFLASRFNEMFPEISPDGRWLLYTSNEPGRDEVFVRALGGEGGPIQVSVGGGTEPLWSRDGSAIYYRGRTRKLTGRPGVADLLFRVRVSRGKQGLAFGSPAKVVEGEYGLATPGRSWDLAPDERFVFVKTSEASGTRAWLEKVLSDRIRIDFGGLPELLVEAGKQQPAP